MKSLEELLTRTSRTFAITIPYLPGLPRREVTLAYLLLRIVDTMEDGILWPLTDRIRSLGEMVDFLADPTSNDAVGLAIQWCDPPPCRNVEYLELLSSFPQVIAEILDLEPAVSAIIFRHARRVTSGMVSTVANPPQDLKSLRQYCYYVAGIVGELITDLFLLRVNATADQGARLRELAILFGEGLQLVNILKDVDADAQEGRQYLPAHLDKQEVFKLARLGLEAASEYTKLLQVADAPAGIVLFTAIPTALAQATLLRIERQAVYLGCILRILVRPGLHIDGLALGTFLGFDEQSEDRIKARVGRWCEIRVHLGSTDELGIHLLQQAYWHPDDDARLFHFHFNELFDYAHC